jgi:hypothetical protein
MMTKTIKEISMTDDENEGSLETEVEKTIEKKRRVTESMKKVNQKRTQSRRKKRMRNRKKRNKRG